jgi:hypothetical protein
MDPLTRVREYLLDNVGHLTRPGHPSRDAATSHWHVPIYCITRLGDRVIGDVEVDEAGHIVAAPSKEELLSRLQRPGMAAAS